MDLSPCPLTHTRAQNQAWRRQLEAAHSYGNRMGCKKAGKLKMCNLSLPLDVVVATLRKFYFTPLHNSRDKLGVQFFLTTPKFVGSGS